MHSRDEFESSQSGDVLLRVISRLEFQLGYPNSLEIKDKGM